MNKPVCRRCIHIRSSHKDGVGACTVVKADGSRCPCTAVIERKNMDQSDFEWILRFKNKLDSERPVHEPQYLEKFVELKV